MWRNLAKGWQQAREQAALQRRRINDALWNRTLIRYPFLQHPDDPGAAALRRLAALFLDSKEFHAVGKVRLTNAVALTVAVQACVPVRQVGLDWYSRFVGIVLRDDAVLAPRCVADDLGVVHEYTEALSGEAIDGGPMMLSWPDVRRAAETAPDGYNLVIHECAHVIDAHLGLSAGDSATGRLLREAHERMLEQCERGQQPLLDDYAATSVAEYFAVASEAFFVAPQRVVGTSGALYQALRELYRQDPAAQAPR